MQTGILKKIDLLVEMAESNASVDTLKAELKEIENEISELKDELISLRESREEKYFKVTEKQVDENIKVSLDAKLKKQEKAIKKLQKEIDSVVEEETSLHNKIQKLKEDLKLSNDYIGEINKRISIMHNSSTKEYYNAILTSEKDKVKALETLLEESQKREETTLDKLDTLNETMEQLVSENENDKQRLEETVLNLSNPNSYLDEELKEHDDKKLQELQKHISDLEKRRLEIITDPVIIANDAKEFIVNEEKGNALTKLQELVTIVKSKPYMDIPSSSELTAMLEEEEETATSARDEFASFIDTKNYSSGDTEIIEERIHFLNDEIKELEDKIKGFREEIADIDTTKFKSVTDHLEHVVETYEQLKKELEEYKVIIETENDDKTPKRRAILSAAYERKQKELEDVENIIERYKENQRELVKRAYDLENITIKEYEKTIENHKQEIRTMEFLLENVSKAKDVLAIENDKQKLKDLDIAVKNIKHRQKYNQTPSEIYDEIEVQLGTMDLSNSVLEKEEDVEEEIVPKKEDVDDFVDINTVMDELPKEEETVSFTDIPVIEEQEDENPFVIGEYENSPSIDEIPNLPTEENDEK